MAQVLTEQATEPAVRAWTRLLRAYVSTTRSLSAELLEGHGLTLNDYEALLVLSRAEEGRLKRVELARSACWAPCALAELRTQPGYGAEAARSGSRFAAFGVPRPVVGSQPGDAL